MYSFGFFIILITQVFVISCEERESWNEERRHVHHYGHSAPDDQYVMVVEYDNCAAQDYPHRKATVTKVPFNDMHRYHRYHPTHANSKANANQMRRSLDDNSNVNTNVNTNSVRRSLDDKNSNVNTNVNTNQMRRSLDANSNVNTNVNSNQMRRSLDDNSNVNTNVNSNQMRRSLDENRNVNTNVNSNQMRRSLDDNSNVNTNVNSNQMRRSLDKNTNVNVNTNSLGGDGDGADILVNDHEVDVEARRSHESNGSRWYGNHNHVPNPYAKSRRNSRNQLNSLYGHQRSNSQGLRRNVLVENKGERVEVDDNEGNVYVEHAVDYVDNLAP